jgi:hypothetical protein
MNSEQALVTPRRWFENGPKVVLPIGFLNLSDEISGVIQELDSANTMLEWTGEVPGRLTPMGLRESQIVLAVLLGNPPQIDYQKEERVFGDSAGGRMVAGRRTFSNCVPL